MSGPGYCDMTTNLLNFDLQGLIAFCEGLGEKRFRATQLFRWIHQRGASDFDQMTDLAKSLREKLKTQAVIEGLSVITQHESRDGTSNGCLMWGTEMRWNRSLFLKMIAAHCACRRRQVVPWVAASVPQAIKALAATLPRVKSWPSCGLRNTFCASTCKPKTALSPMS